MINERIIAFVQWHREQGCEMELVAGTIGERMDGIAVPSVLTERYGVLPECLSVWIQLVRKLVAPQEQAWFLTAEHYNEQRDDGLSDRDVGFVWNEWERISLDAAAGDVEWQQQIRSFWDRYVPVVMIVQPEYAFYAIDTHSVEGAVIYGREPEFEDGDKVAASFDEFLQTIVQGTLKWYSQE
ncbi:hypothetical protein [Paenibacillus campi]|uniref:hypothetical protein n=1 Tax=Paenibacillus campi TaxID=3106031 RepID=UPI002AFF6F6D|nr:hypothetical protein [Paenibacillus sp. SGZ-1009]